MPTLADIYSAINTAKRKGADFVQNPGTSLQQMLGNANDKARGFNQLNDQALAELEQTGQLSGPAAKQLMGKVAGAYNPIGMTAWHGSPHIFEKFDSSKIGSGQGAQAYGRGLYMAEKKDVSLPYMQPAYKDMVGTSIDGKPINSLNLNYEQYTAARAAERAGGIPQAIEKYTNEVNSALSKGNKKYAEGMQEVLDSIKSLPGKEIQKTIDQSKNLYSGHNGFLYKVDLPDTHVRRMLDWDAPLKDQPRNVRALAKQLGMDMNDLGGDLVAKVGKDEAGKEIMQKANIRGIKYFNEQGVKTKEPSRNFVVFDPNHLTILERNSEKLK